MINLEYDSKIKEWIDKNRDSVIEKWINIARIPAIKGEPVEGAPFGVDCARALDACAELFRDAGFGTETYSGGYALSGYGRGETTIGLFGHSDVVPVGDDWIYTKPFEPKVIDNTLIGRGVEDNKSGIMASYCIMNILREYNIPLKSQVMTFIGSEEETGMTDIEAFAREQKMPDASLVLDADFPCSIGEKSIYHFYAKNTCRAEKILDFKGGEAFNIVLDKAKAVLEYSPELKNVLEEKTKDRTEFGIEYDDNTITVVAKGIAKHACEPDGGINSAYLLAELLCDVEELPETDRDIMEDVKRILSCPYGTSMGIDHDDIRFGRLTFVNGMVSMDDGKISLSFDTRYGSTLEPEVLEKRISESFGRLGWTVEPLSNMKGFSIADNSPIPDKLVGIYNAVTGFEEKAIRLGGGTYARKLKNAFSVGTKTSRADRTTPFFEMPAGHGGAHQCDEMIDLEAFFDAVRILCHYVINIDECL